MHQSWVKAERQRSCLIIISELRTTKNYSRHPGHAACYFPTWGLHEQGFCKSVLQHIPPQKWDQQESSGHTVYSVTFYTDCLSWRQQRVPTWPETWHTTIFTEMQIAGDLAVIPIQTSLPEGTPLAELLFLSNLYWKKSIICTTPGPGAGRVGRQWQGTEGQDEAVCKQCLDLHTSCTSVLKEWIQ